MAFLCISLNNSSVNVVHIMDGELLDIDKYTIKYNNANEILKEFPEKIDELNNRFNLDSNDSDVRVRIFLPNDKEQFVMYKRHLIAFKYLIKKRDFLRYAISYDSSIFSKKECELINHDGITSAALASKINSIVNNYDEDTLYSVIRKICEQYINYIEDNEDMKNPSIEEIYKTYLSRLKTGKIVKNNKAVNVKKEEKKINPFAVFEHPNFSKVYGNAINPGKPIFILGDQITENSKSEYKELYENCKKCFSNPVYCPLNSDVAGPMNEEFVNIYKDSLLVIIDGNGYNNNLIEKINYAIKNNITTLILVSNDEMNEFYSKYYSKFDIVIIKKYAFKDFDSKKQFGDIMAGLYINEYKKSKNEVGQ